MKRSWFIGVDISKKTLDVAIYDPKLKKCRKHFKVENSPKGFREMVKTLKGECVKIDEAFLCMEYCGVYGLEIGFFLDGKIDYCFCAPLQIKRSLGISRGKNDKLDAMKIARFCYLLREELEPATMPNELMLSLKALMAERSRLIKVQTMDKTVLSELQSTLPESSIKRAQQRLIAVKADIRAIEKEIVSLIGQDPELQKTYKLLTSIVGISVVNATMMILLTNNFKGITDARAFACYCGIAPFEHTSGTSIKGKTKVSKMGNRPMKAMLSNSARSAIVHDPELRIYYKRKREEGKSHGTVMNAVKFKIITRAYAVINRGTPFVKLRQAG
jgi:transposase